MQEVPRRAVDEYSRFAIIIFDDVTDFINELPKEDGERISGHLGALGEDQTQGIIVKRLKGKICELVARRYRIVFFRIDGVTYVVDIFKKESKKTPLRIIRRAERMYSKIIRQTL